MKTLLIICSLAISMNVFAGPGASTQEATNTLTITTTAPTVISSLGNLNFCKEEIKAVEPDAYEFIAGGELSLALSEVIDLIRENEASLEKASDLDIALAMIETSEK